MKNDLSIKASRQKIINFKKMDLNDEVLEGLEDLDLEEDAENFLRFKSKDFFKYQLQ